jgi:hypothetical protein
MASNTAARAPARAAPATVSLPRAKRTLNSATITQLTMKMTATIARGALVALDPQRQADVEQADVQRHHRDQAGHRKVGAVAQDDEPGAAGGRRLGRDVWEAQEQQRRHGERDGVAGDQRVVGAVRVDQDPEPRDPGPDREPDVRDRPQERPRRDPVLDRQHLRQQPLLHRARRPVDRHDQAHRDQERAERPHEDVGQRRDRLPEHQHDQHLPRPPPVRDMPDRDPHQQPQPTGDRQPQPDLPTAQPDQVREVQNHRRPQQPTPDRVGQRHRAERPQRGGGAQHPHGPGQF